MMRTRLSRRTLLRGAGGICLGLPFLEATHARAQSVSAPTRFVVFYSPNGTIEQDWFPATTGSAFEIRPILTPLASLKSKLLVLGGIDYAASYTGIAGGHIGGMSSMLTGTGVLEGDLFETGSGTPTGWGGGISVDQAIANGLTEKGRFPSLEFGVQTGSPTVFSRMCYRAPNEPIPPQDSPQLAFDYMFKDYATGAGELERIRAERKSVLDAVKQDFQRLNARLGASDRQRLDAHLTHIRDIEKRLAELDGSLAASCTIPSRPSLTAHMDEANYPAVGRLQMDLLVIALKCNFTRVASLQWSKAVSGVKFGWLGSFSKPHHGMSHDESAYRSELVKINTWYAQQLAYLANAMNAIQEGDRTLLDNSLVIWTNELSNGDAHSRKNVPIAMLGSCGGKLRTGRYVKYAGRSNNDLFVSCMNAMGVPATSFGEAQHSIGPLPDLT